MRIIRKIPNQSYKWIITILCFLLILPIWNIGKGIVDYFQGEARIRITGYPSPEFANINQEFRIENKSLGCTYTGLEHLTSFRYNQTVKFLIKKFGYQKNSYIGVLPTEERAKQYFSNNDYDIGKAEMSEEKIIIIKDSNMYQVNLMEQHGLVKETIKESELIPTPKLKMVDECLVVELNKNWIYLIEMKNKKVIAQYRT